MEKEVIHCIDYSHFLFNQTANAIYVDIQELRFIDYEIYLKNKRRLLEDRLVFVEQIFNFTKNYLPNLKINEEVLIGGWKNFRYHQQLIFIEGRLEKMLENFKNN